MKALLAVVSLLTLALLIYFFLPSNGFEELDEEIRVESIKKEVSQEDLIGQTKEEKVAVEDAERKQREETYAKLEKSRRNLDRSLARLKAYLWDVKLPPEEAKAINKELMSAYRLLKNKKLMGAFPSQAALEDELTKVNYYHNKAKEITGQIKELDKKN